MPRGSAQLGANFGDVRQNESVSPATSCTPSMGMDGEGVRRSRDRPKPANRAMPSVPNAMRLSIGLFCLLDPRVVEAAGWRRRPSPSSWAAVGTGRRLPSPSSPSSRPSRGREGGDDGRSIVASLGMGTTNWELLARHGLRRRYLASIVASAVHRGGSDEAGDEDDGTSDGEASEGPASEEGEVSEEGPEEEPIVAATDDVGALEGGVGDEGTAPAVAERGGREEEEDDDHDEERYSRQMYALGARAHGQIRSTTVVLDGPLGGTGACGDDDGTTPSGLLYEVAKNLALSGVGRIVLARDDDDDATTEGTSPGYFDGSLDDLGAAYRRAALAEVGIGGVDPETAGGEGANNDGAELLAEFVRRLNPGVRVDVVRRSDLFRALLEARGAAADDDDDDNDENDEFSLGDNPVVVCVDRSTAAQLEMNDACRGGGGGSSTVPFVSAGTAGVHARLFCDFGPRFTVVDEDGDAPRSTLLDRVEGCDPPLGGDDTAEGTADRVFTVHCLDGERHDVSKGDVIEFQGEHSDDGHLGDGGGGNFMFPKCQVESVKSPTCFTVREWDGRGGSKDGADEKTDSFDAFSPLLEGRARSFSRVKVPKQLSFSSLREILKPSSSREGQGALSVSDCWADDALFAPILDKSFDPLRRQAVMTSMAALDAFVEKYGRLPSKDVDESTSKNKRTDVERFRSLVRKLTAKEDEETATLTKDEKRRWESLISQFARTCRAKFTPVQALAGALGAQEVLKAASGLYNPFRQFLLYDCDEVLVGDPSEADGGVDGHDTGGVGPEEGECELPRGQSYILGDSTARKLARSRLFVVGAGAIGCELLKNLAAMGAGTGGGPGKEGGGGGRLILTDMDSIEKSNLSRQLLFRDHNVGEFKSVAARAAARRFSPSCRIEAHTCRVGEDDDGPFDDTFWSAGCDVVLNALDNVEARLFVDSQCVAHGIGLIDAGTLGPKGNVQVVVPGASESYGSSADPPEPDVPVCTLKNFPYEISHTIQWARDLFDGYFYRRPQQANDHVEEVAEVEDLTEFGRALVDKLGEIAAVDMAEELGEDLGVFPFIVGNADTSDPEYLSAVKKVSLNWAIREVHRLFYAAMNELLQKHPEDSVDDDGAAFWSGTRRKPRLLRFVPLDSEEGEVSAQQVIINERIAQFVCSAARLRMESFLPFGNDSVDKEISSISLDEALVALEEQSKILYKKTKRKEILHNLSGGGGDGDPALSRVLEKLNSAKTGASFLPKLNPAEFEKDDESNGHVAFVTAASNLRAAAYGIPPADAMETRRIAGRIVPAMITTTGLVSALSCLELVKMVRGSLPLAAHRNAFANLALPFFAFTAPVPAEELVGAGGRVHTIWDRIEVKEGGSKSLAGTMTLGKFLKKIRKKAGCGEAVEIASLSYGPFMIFANFLHAGDEDLLGMPLLDTVRDAVISDDDDDLSFVDADEVEVGVDKDTILTMEQKAILCKLEQKRFIDFSVTVEDQETGEEFELPTVRFIKD